MHFKKRKQEQNIKIEKKYMTDYREMVIRKVITRHGFECNKNQKKFNGNLMSIIWQDLFVHNVMWSWTYILLRIIVKEKFSIEWEQMGLVDVAKRVHAHIKTC